MAFISALVFSYPPKSIYNTSICHYNRISFKLQSKNSSSIMLKALELYCGIGGFAKACEEFDIEVIKAYDQNENALLTYNANFSHKAEKFNLEQISSNLLDEINADFLWMSPPCQPYTKKGIQKDIKDPRSKSFLKILESLLTCKTPPSHIGLENVEYFKYSQARELLIETLTKMDYYIRETTLCPTKIGIPNRRERYYMVASVKPLKKLQIKYKKQNLLSFLLHPQNPSFIPKETKKRFQKGFRIIDKIDEDTYTTCFTSSYGKSWMHSGAYLQEDNNIRLFEPEEIALLLGFTENFILPKQLSKRTLYKLLGNSISVYALKAILTQFDI